jgi:hypothetical protein
MKEALAWIFIFAGLIVGIINILLGFKRAQKDKIQFDFYLFIKKSLRKTPIKAFSGQEMIGYGILSILFSLLIYVIFFKV